MIDKIKYNLFKTICFFGNFYNALAAINASIVAKFTIIALL